MLEFIYTLFQTIFCFLFDAIIYIATFAIILGTIAFAIYFIIDIAKMIFRKPLTENL